MLSLVFPSYDCQHDDGDCFNIMEVTMVMKALMKKFKIKTTVLIVAKMTIERLMNTVILVVLAMMNNNYCRNYDDGDNTDE